MFIPKHSVRTLMEGDGAGGAGGSGDGKTPPAPDNLEAYIAGLPDDQKKVVSGLLESHTSGLKSALDKERDNAKTYERQLRDAAKQAEGNPKLQKELTDKADELKAATRQRDFYASGHKQGITNLELAYIAADSSKLIDDDGKVDWSALKKKHPELFKPVPPGDGGAGGKNKAAGSMNDWIRRKAGRG